MAIMAILSAALAYVMAGAQESAQIAKTKALIARLHSLMMQKYESYRYRRLPVQLPPNLPPRQLVKLRCDVIRELMRLEMPERWTDVLDAPAMISARPSCSSAYLAQLAAHINQFPKDKTIDQGAKCLYLIVTMGLDEPDVMENFSETDVAYDPDGSQMKVFVDAWGHPIQFLRWAPGFASGIQPLAPPTAATKDYRMRDQTDPSGVYGSPKPGPFSAGSGGGRVSGNTFALYPLIYSAGPDGNWDIVTDAPRSDRSPPFETTGPLSGMFAYSLTNPPNDPFVSVSDTTHFTDGPIGLPAVEPSAQRGTRALGDSDNIHNQSIGAR